jgi:hypothetical protein
MTRMGTITAKIHRITLERIKQVVQNAYGNTRIPAASLLGSRGSAISVWDGNLRKPIFWNFRGIRYSETRELLMSLSHVTGKMELAFGS